MTRLSRNAMHPILIIGTVRGHERGKAKVCEGVSGAMCGHSELCAA